MKVRILCTLGPASLVPEVLASLDERGVDLFRINLSHTRLEELERTVELVRRHSAIPICLDTQGAQVRCGWVADGTVLPEGATVRLTADDGEGSATRLGLWPASVFATLLPGALLQIDFHGVLLQVVAASGDEAQATVVVGGRVRSNRAVTIDPAPNLPAVTDVDVAAIDVGVRAGVEQVALSFASCAADVALLRSLLPKGTTVISKIESRTGVRHREEIIDASDAVLIDRGDLSREVPMEYVPFYQKAIVRDANRATRPVYVATNLLESMVANRRPTVAEVNDIANTLLDGVHGLVLAAETAVGVDPVGAVDAVLRSIKAFEANSARALLRRDRVAAAS